MGVATRISRSSAGTASAASTSAQSMPSTAAATNRTALPRRDRRGRDRDDVAPAVLRIGLTLAGALLAVWLVRKQDIDEHTVVILEVAAEPSAA